MSFSAVAAPFCVVPITGPKQCHYFSRKQCVADAELYRGICVLNPDEPKSEEARGNAPFCIVTGFGKTLCTYYDGVQCRSDAKIYDGECVANPTR